MGLLSRASELENKKSLAFPDFIMNYHINTFAVFKLKNNFFSIEYSLGFDGVSLISSLSSQDFWSGICEENKRIYNFSCYNKSLNPILQFFSFQMKEEINTVSLYKTTEHIFMLCNQELTTSMIDDLSNIDFNLFPIKLDKINEKITSESSLHEYEIDFEEAVNNYLISKGKDVNSFFDIICNELVNIFSVNFSFGSLSRITKSKIKAIVILHKNISKEHFITHIVSLLSTVISNSSQLISFNFIGNAESLDEITKFLG